MNPAAILRQSSSSAAEEMMEMETKPFLSKFLSYPPAAAASTSQRLRAKHLGSPSPATPSPSRQNSFGRDIGHAAKETYLVTSLSFTLLQYLGLPVDHKGTISDMVEDASNGISFICNNIADYGGDPDRIYLMGQSAGAHISSCALLEQAIRESKKEEIISWSVSQIKAYFGLSGGYNLFNLVDHFDCRGLCRSIFLSIMEGEESLHQFSPEVRVQDPRNKDAISILPPITLFHGTADYSIPSDASKFFVDVLQRVGAQADLVLYDGKNHTDLFLQDPLRGGKDDLFDQLVAVIHANDKEALEQDAAAPPRRRLVPEILLKLAGNISPF